MEKWRIVMRNEGTKIEKEAAIATVGVEQYDNEVSSGKADLINSTIAIVGVEKYDNKVEDFIRVLSKTPYGVINTESNGEEGRMREYAGRMLLAICFHYYKYTQSGNRPIDFITDLLSTEDMLDVIEGERYRSGDGVPECYGDYMLEFSGKYVEWLYDEKTGLMPCLSRERDNHS
jgi:hypothetical protein